MPSPDPDTPAHAVLFRPPGDGRFRWRVIAHATTQNVLRRAQMPQPEYRALAACLVARGFAVLVPERPGHGATGGNISKTRAAATKPTMRAPGAPPPTRSRPALDFLRAQPFIRPDGAVIVGHSAGGWGALALASEDPKAIAAIIAFAPGRGGHANDFANQVCAPHTLMPRRPNSARRAGAGDLAGGRQ